MKYLPHFIIVSLISLFLWSNNSNVRTKERLKIIKESLDSTKIEKDKLFNAFISFRDSLSPILNHLSNKIDSVSRLSSTVILQTRTKVDTFRISLPDSLKERFDSIIANYETIVKLKDTEIQVYKDKDVIVTSISQMQNNVLEALKSYNTQLEIAFKQAYKAARPSLFKRVFNKLPELAVIGLFILLRGN